MRAAVVAVVVEEGRPLHWTVIQDLALRRGYVDPFVTRDLRRQVLAALADAAREGAIVRTGRGEYGPASA